MTRYNIDTCAMLVEFNASQWTARKLDKGATDEIVHNKNAQDKGAARVNKNLLAGRKELEVINKRVSEVRQYVYDNTSPWSDSGLRLLPNTRFIKFAERMNEFDEEIAALVKAFVLLEGFEHVESLLVVEVLHLHWIAPSCLHGPGILGFVVFKVKMLS